MARPSSRIVVPADAWQVSPQLTNRMRRRASAATAVAVGKGPPDPGTTVGTGVGGAFVADGPGAALAACVGLAAGAGEPVRASQPTVVSRNASKARMGRAGPTLRPQVDRRIGRKGCHARGFREAQGSTGRSSTIFIEAAGPYIPVVTSLKVIV